METRDTADGHGDNGHWHNGREVTVSDVAAAAGVAKATAARALGDYGAVSESARDRVLLAAERLGYRPNALARTMSTGRSNTVGMVVGDIENPFFAQATRGAADVAAAAGLDLILSNSDEDAEIEAKAIGVQLAKRVDGLLVAPASSVDPVNLRTVLTARRPLVLFDRTLPGLEVDTVIAANRTGAAVLTSLLMDAGHRRVAFISTLGASVSLPIGRCALHVVRRRARRGLHERADPCRRAGSRVLRAPQRP